MATAGGIAVRSILLLALLIRGTLGVKPFQLEPSRRFKNKQRNLQIFTRSFVNYFARQTFYSQLKVIDHCNPLDSIRRDFLEPKVIHY